jgi:DNA-binding NarL/FixJ family response regulator
VGDYIKQVYKKLNVSCRAEAALEAALEAWLIRDEIAFYLN